MQLRCLKEEGHMAREAHPCHEQTCSFCRICRRPRARSTCSELSYNCCKECSSSSFGSQPANSLPSFSVLFLHEQNGSEFQHGTGQSIANACRAASCIYCYITANVMDVTSLLQDPAVVLLPCCRAAQTRLHQSQLHHSWPVLRLP